MDEKVGDAENGVSWILANTYVHNTTIFKCKNTMNCQRNGDPLVLLDAAVIVGVKGCQLVAIFKWVLLDI